MIPHPLPFCIELVDFPADTVTGTAHRSWTEQLTNQHEFTLVPTEEMYAYATLATLGDDVYFEPTTKYVS